MLHDFYKGVNVFMEKQKYLKTVIKISPLREA